MALETQSIHPAVTRLANYRSRLTQTVPHFLLNLMNQRFAPGDFCDCGDDGLSVPLNRVETRRSQIGQKTDQALD